MEFSQRIFRPKVFNKLDATKVMWIKELNVPGECPHNSGSANVHTARMIQNSYLEQMIRESTEAKGYMVA